MLQDLNDPLPMLTALQTTLDLDGLYDLIEIKLAQRSWEHADVLNQERAERLAKVRGGRV